MAAKHTNPFPPLKRYITTHDEQGKAIISPDFDETLPVTAIKDGEVDFGLCWTTETLPIKLDGSDLDVYTKHLSGGPGISIATGTVMRVVTMAPGHLSPMHRTASLDYGCVLEGECELILDSGEKRVMKRGDTSVQRATNHAWRNPSETEWCRMLYVVVGAEMPKVDGKEMEVLLNGADQGQQ